MAKKRMSSEERRVSILEAAIVIIAQTSFERCTTALIANAAGISEPMIYRHFKSKRDLQVAVLDTIRKGLQDFIADNITTLPSITLPEIRDYAEPYMKQIRKNPKWVTVLLKGIALEDKDAREKIWEIFHALHGAMKMVLNKVPVNEKINHDSLKNMLSWILVSWITVTPAVNLLGKLDELPEDINDRRFSFLEDMLNCPTKSFPPETG